jgi:hypothetical protein
MNHLDAQMNFPEHAFVFEVPTGIRLRTELSLRSLKHAEVNGYLHERTDGVIPSILFGRDEEGRHGNFHPCSYRNICEHEEWAKRLNKCHTAFRRVRVRANWEWKELDCSNSSDALLMNVFCYPTVAASTSVSAVFGSRSSDQPEFGFKPRTPLSNGRHDHTEIDMKLGALLIEAKLTESDFQLAAPHLVFRYKDFEEVFYIADLAMKKGKYVGYQLIRGVLAAHSSGGSFCVLCDARRPDLMEGWFRVIQAVRLSDLRCRLKLLTWQELAIALPEGLQDFLELKYGIIPRS